MSDGKGLTEAQVRDLIRKLSRELGTRGPAETFRATLKLAKEARRAALAERGGSDPSPNRPVVPEERSDG